MHTKLEPKIIQVFREGYSLQLFRKDLLAGVLVGIVALPLAIAFAVASGVKPEQGIYTAIIAGFAISFLGGSRVQISGPTGAFIVVIYDIVQRHGYQGLAIATMLAGLILIVMGIARMGMVLKFVPYPLTVGFTSGIALIIFSSQIRDLFGLSMHAVPADFVEKWFEYADHISSINPWAVLVALISLAIIILWPRVSHKIPSPLVAIVVMTAAVQIFAIPVETIQSRFGTVPSALPAPAFPHLSWELIRELFSPALKIAILGAIESLLAASVADGMVGTRHRSNMELVAQGVGNFLSPLFGGIPATGAIARTATNVKCGGRTPLAGMIHAIFLLLVLMLIGPWAALIPLSALGAILVVVAYNMSEWRTFLHMLRAPRGDVAVLLVTFLLTVLIDLTVAIEVGVVLAAFLFLQRIESVTEIGSITKELDEIEEEEDRSLSISSRTVPDSVEVFEVFGPLFFGAVDRFNNAMSRVEKMPTVFILRMRNVPAIDATGLRALAELLSKMKRAGCTLVLSGARPQPVAAMVRARFIKEIGEQNMQPNIDAALERAKAVLIERAKVVCSYPQAENKG